MLLAAIIIMLLNLNRIFRLKNSNNINIFKSYESSNNETQSPQNNWQRKEMRQLIYGTRDQTMEHYHQPKKKNFNAKFIPAATQKDISQLLKEFTVYFLLNGIQVKMLLK